MSDETDSIHLEERKNKSYNTVARAEEGGDDDYDPHVHRKVENGTTNFETLAHLLKGSLGTGILAMPQAFSNSGYVNGFISTILLGALATYGLHVLVRSQYILCKRHRVPVLTYPISMKMALEEGPPYLRFLAPTAIVIVDGFLVIYQSGICCVYIVFVAENIKQLVDQYLIELDVRIHECIIILPLLLMFLIRNLKLLAPFSTFANLITFIGMGLILYYVFRDIQPISTRSAFVDITRYPLFFGTVLFALEAVGVIITLENNMKTPKSFGGYFGILNIGMAVITALYALVGLFGYITYGEDSKGSVTLNVPDGEIISQSIKVMMTVAVFISYALQGYVPFNIIWNTYLKQKYENTKHEAFMEYLIRILIVLVTFLLAVAIPRLGLFISLVGAFCLSILGFLFPAILELCVLYPDNYGAWNYVFYKDILLVLFSFIGLTAGTYVSVRDIILSFQDKPLEITDRNDTFLFNSTLMNNNN